MHLAATSLILLATKHTEVPRKVRDIVNCGYWLLNHQNEDQGYLDVGEDSELYANLRDSLITAELFSLRVLNFNTNTDLAYVPVAIITHSLWRFYTLKMSDREMENFAGEFKKLCESAVQIVCDSYVNARVALEFSGVEVALACVFIAVRNVKLELPLKFEVWCMDPVDPDIGKYSNNESEHLISKRNRQSLRGEKDRVQRVLVCAEIIQK
ncbi:hypothetical protein HK098_005609, partial [Nowakowskiella sp. JEL0407]